MALNLRREELRRAGLTLQPLVLFVGSLESIDAAYVAVNDTLYKTDSSCHAVNLCFQSYFALEAAYPHQSSSLWRFVQISCYDIRTREDVCSRSLNVLIGEVEHQLVNNI